MASDVFENLAGCLTLFMLIFSVLGGEKPLGLGLYSYDDDIVILNASNFAKLVHNSECSWVIEFYNSWCGHCIRFAPTWKELGTDVKGWSDVIKVGAMDCANKENNVLCRNNDIKGFPTFKLLAAHSDKNATGVTFSSGSTANEIHRQLIDYLQVNETGVPGIRNKLQHLNDMNGIWKQVDSLTEHTVIIFEEPKSYLGREVILDISKHKELLVRRMIKPDVVKYGISKFPSMQLIEKKEAEGKFTLLADNTDRKGFTQALLSLLGIQESDSEDAEGAGLGQVPSTIKSLLPSNDILDKYGGRVHMQDLLSALHYSLRQEVAVNKNIKDKALSALKKYTSVLSKFFPGEDGVRLWLKKVDQSLHKENGPLDSQKWLTNLEDVQSPIAYLSPEVRWTGCAGSDIKYRGYPCALWTLFHSLTVNAVLKNGHDPSFDPHEVLIAMREYISNFFGCEECRKNFNRGAVKIETYVKTANESILFLWRSHNKANDRLAGDPSEDPTHPKAQFPNDILCPACHIAGSTSKENAWDQKKVLEFLTKMYAKENLVMDAVQDRMEDINPKFKNILANRKKRLSTTTALSRVNVEKVDRWKQRELETRFHLTGEGGVGFSGIDLSICIMFYLICSIIIIFVCFHFTVHRKMRPNFCSKAVHF